MSVEDSMADRLIFGSQQAPSSQPGEAECET